MKIKADEIASVLRKEIEDYARDLEMDEVGSILEVGDGIARVYGLKNVMSGELLEFPNKIMGLALNLEETSVGVVLLGDYTALKEGDQVKRTRKVMSVPVGEAMIGRVVNPLGQPIDDKGPIASTASAPARDRSRPGIAGRQPVNEPLQTGIKAIDAMIPIGRGQRELIIGDRQTGKTAIAIDTIINQKGEGVICVYVAIGQKASTTADPRRAPPPGGRHGLHDRRLGRGVRPGSAPVHRALRRRARIAEYFMYEKGGATLCIYDDLSKQASAYRELSLLLRRPPGREAYPGRRLLSPLASPRALGEDEGPLDHHQEDRGQGREEGPRRDRLRASAGKHVADMVIDGFDATKYEVKQLKKGEAAPQEVNKWAIVKKGHKVSRRAHMLFDDQGDGREVLQGPPRQGRRRGPAGEPVGWLADGSPDH